MSRFRDFFFLEKVHLEIFGCDLLWDFSSIGKTNFGIAIGPFIYVALLLFCFDWFKQLHHCPFLPPIVAAGILRSSFAFISEWLDLFRIWVRPKISILVMVWYGAQIWQQQYCEAQEAYYLEAIKSWMRWGMGRNTIYILSWVVEIILQRIFGTRCLDLPICKRAAFVCS